MVACVADTLNLLIERLRRETSLASGFFMENRKPQNSKCLRSCGRVCSLQFTFERQEGLPAVSDLRQGFLPLKIAQPCV